MPPELVRELRAVARNEGATFFMTMLAAFETLLARFARQDDFVVGTPFEGRGRTEVEDVIGVFINTLPLRSDVPGAGTFRELLRRVRRRMGDAIAHQDVPFERIVQDLQAERDHSRHPIFQVLLAVNQGGPDLSLPGLSVEEIETAKTSARVDLSLILFEREDDVDMVWEYSTDLFDAETVERLIASFLKLLEAVVSDPSLELPELPVLADADRDKLLVEWNETAREYPSSTVQELVAAQARSTPDAVAVVAGEQQLTYLELDKQANQLAHRLAGLGVERGSLVGIAVSRSTDLLVGLLGILKSGGAYVPVDPTYP